MVDIYLNELVELPLGIEPSYHDYKSCASPAMLWGLIVEDTGIEPVTSCM